MKQLFLVFISLLFTSPSFAKEEKIDTAYYPLNQYIATTWTIREELPDNNIPDILQDNKGFIWMASYTGLIRFDSINFEVITKYTFPTFDSSTARVLLEDSKGSLWVGTNGSGLARLKNGVFTMFRREDGLPSLNIRKLVEDSKGNIIVGTTSGVAVFKNNRFINITKNTPFQSQIIEMLYKDKAGRIWMGTSQKGLFQIINNQIVTYTVFPEFNNYQFLSMRETPTGEIWLGTVGKGLIRVKDGRVQYVSIQNNITPVPVNSILLGKDNTIWAGTDRGVIRMKGDEVQRYTEKDGLNSGIVSKIIEDKERNIWISTSRGGVTKLSIGKFQSLSTKNGLVNNKVNAILTVGDKTWIGTDAGLSILKGQTVIHDPVIEQIGKERIRYLHQDPTGRIWINTYGKKGVLIYENGTLKSFNKKNGLSDNRTRVTITTQDGDTWIGTKNGLNRIHNGQVIRYTEKDGLLNDYILCLFQDSKGRLWIGTDGNGIYRYFNHQFINYSANKGLPGSVVFKFFEDSSQHLWVATNSGLSKLKDDSFVSYTKQQGMRADAIYHIFEDKHRRLWLTSSNGVFTGKIEDFEKIDRNEISQLEMKLYDVKDGLNGGILATAWGEVSANGTILLPTSAGIAFINPEKIPINSVPPSIVADHIVVNDSVVKSKNLKSLSPGTHRITVNYKGLSYVKPDYVRFQYKLEGFDEDWSFPTGKREVSYTSLPPGTYEFKLRAANSDNIWSEDYTPIRFTQEPHFYQSLWFIILCIIALVALTALVFIIRIRILQRQKEQLEQTVRARTKEIQGKNKELSQINEKLTESIRYAQTIQQSILPDLEIIKLCLPNSFFIWQPRDIVGGDFYQLYKIENEYVLVLADCTGHGVPGGFMTMLTVASIRRIIFGKKQINPGLILSDLNKLIQESLKENTGQLKTDDGLDCAVCLIKPAEKIIQFAGGNLSLVKILFGDAVVHKGDRKGVGHRRIDPDYEYKTHTIKVDPGTSFYMYTDGITDQMGGERRSKFGKKKLLNLLSGCHEQSFEKQKEILLGEFEAYRGGIEPRDDMTIVGFKID